jgi:hypothetical protein
MHLVFLSWPRVTRVVAPNPRPQLPLHVELQSSSDAGTPIVALAPQGPLAQEYVRIAQRVWQQLGRPTAPGGAGPDGEGGGGGHAAAGRAGA